MTDAAYQFTVVIGGTTLKGVCTDYTCSAQDQGYVFNKVVLEDGRRLSYLTASRCQTVIMPIHAEGMR